MSETATAAALQKTPRYAWVCLAFAVLAPMGIVFCWMWLPGITFGTFFQWIDANSPAIGQALHSGAISSVMGLEPIGACIMALPTSLINHKLGPKAGFLIGIAFAGFGTLLAGFTVTTSLFLFLTGRFLLGLGLAAAVVSGPTCVSMWFPDTTRGRAMAIWSCWAPVGIFVSSAISSQVLDFWGGNVATLQIFWAIVVLITGVLLAIFFRSPRPEERSEVSPERKPFREIMPFFKSRQLWCLIIMFAIFNYMNYAFSQNLKSWMVVPIAAGGLGWDAAKAGLLGGLICACGALAPIGGLILDKTPKGHKYIIVVLGIVFLTLACTFAFENGKVFIPYVIFFCLGNMLLNAACRPQVPTLVSRGGASAVSWGLSFLTLGQYAGQIATSYALAGFTASLTAGVQGTGSVEPMLAFWPLVIPGVVGILLSLGVRPSKKKEK